MAPLKTTAVSQLVQPITVSWNKNVRPHLNEPNMLLNQTLCHINEIVSNYSEKAIQKSLKELLNFIDTTHIGNELPTGLIFSGIHPSDHDQLFSELSRKLSEKEHLLVQLYAKECTNMKITMKNLIEQCILSLALTDTSEKSLQETLTYQPEKKRKMAHYDFQKLLYWHQQNSVKHLVILIKDFEAFDKEILGNLISIFNS